VEPSETSRIAELMAALRPSLSEARVEIRGGFNRPPMHESSASALFPLAERAAASVGIEAVRGVAVGGGSDGNFTAAVGVPTLDGLGAVGGGAHADTEHVLVDEMIPRARLVAALVEEIRSRQR
jgi:glutamate carboxypeptidase